MTLKVFGKKVFGKPSVQTVLIVPFVLQVTVAVGLSGYFSWRSGQQAVTEVALQLSNEVTTRIHQHVGYHMRVPQMVVQMNADSMKLGEIAWDGSRTIERHLWYQMRQFTSLSPIAFGDEQGRIWAVDRQDTGALVIRVIDASTAGKYHTYATTDQGDRERLLQVSTTFDPRTRPWYRDAAIAGKPIWTDIYPYFSSPGLAISAASPFYNPETNELMGVTNATINLTQLSRFLQDVEVGRSGQLFIVERSGDLVATSTSEQPFVIEHRGNVIDRLPAIASQDPMTRLTSQQLLQQFGTFEGIHHNQQLKFEDQGDRYFVQVAPFADLHGLDWLIVVVIPEADFTAQLTANTHTTITLCLMTLAGAIAFGLVVTQSIVKPIVQLCNASQAMAEGRLNQHLDDGLAIQELDAMAQSFNQMSGQLQRSFEKVSIALQESEEKFTKVFRNSPDPMVIATLDEGRYVEVNDSALRCFGFSHEEMIGHTSVELNIWEKASDRDEYKRQLEEYGFLRNYEINFRTKTQTIKTMLVSTDLIELEGKRYIVSVGKDISDRKQTEELVRASLDAKEVLLKEVHHRVKNNLQIISSLLRLQSRSVEDEQMKNLFQESQNRVQAMALIHEKLYKSKDLACVDLGNYTLTLVEELMQSYGVQSSSIQLTVQLSDVYLDIDTAIACGLIINELVTNALKYAFPDHQGEIKIQGRAIADSQYELVITDNGVGLPETLNIQQTTTLGLRLVRSLVRQLHGTFSLDRNNGTSVTISFSSSKEPR